MATDRELNRLRVKAELADVVSVAAAATPTGTSPLVNTYTAVGAEALSNRLDQFEVTFPFDDAATAGTAFTETVMHTSPVACKLISASFSLPIAATASDSLYATVSIAKRTSAGATSTALASRTTQITLGTGNVTAFAKNALTLTTTTADLEIAADSVITLAVAKASTGTALTAATSKASVTLVFQKV